MPLKVSKAPFIKIFFILIGIMVLSSFYPAPEGEGKSSKSPEYIASPDDIVGVWINKRQTIKVQIEKVNNKYTGKLIWLHKPLDASGKPKTDFLNPKKELRSRPLMGMKVMNDLNYDHSNVWDNGRIYDPESGNTYSCRITVVDKKIALVRGYFLLPIIGRDEVCFRVEK